MGVDRIGSGGGAPPAVPIPKEGAGRTTGAGSATAPFEARRSEVDAPRPPTEVQPSAPLEAVRNGTLDVKGYVDARVEEATAHLSHLSPTQLEAVRSVVRGQLLADPHLAELVHQATGQPLPEEQE